MSSEIFYINILRAAVVAFLLFAGPNIFAQQVYVSWMDVYYPNDGQLVAGDFKCPDSTTTLASTSRSMMVPNGNDNPWTWSALIEYNQMQGSYTHYDATGNSVYETAVAHRDYPGSCLTLCASIKCTSELEFGIDEMYFEVFKYADGINPLDSGSAPSLRTYFNYDIGVCPSSSSDHPIGTYCTSWDASYNIDGEFGRTNGLYGFRATVKTNYVTDDANIAIEQTSAYPGKDQIPIQVDVMDIHCVQTTPTVVGSTTPVAAAPYNIVYRLSKDGYVNIGVFEPSESGTMTLKRVVAYEQAKIGEGTPDGTLQNGDAWDGRDYEGKLLPAGNYILQIDAHANDEWGRDDAYRAHRQISIDPLQMTDFAVSALESLSTSQAYIKYVLTESATVYTRIYNPDCQLTNVNNTGTGGPTVLVASGTAASPIRSFSEVQTGRTYSYTYWDGRDDAGNAVDDGNYLVVQWAEIPDGSGGKVYTQKFYQRVITISRGYVGITGPSVDNTSIGSSPTVSGLNPFFITYLLSRSALVSVRVMTADGNTQVRTIISSEARAASSEGTNTEVWDGRDDNGYYVSSGVYMMEVSAQDHLFPSRVTRKMTMFAVDLFRITDVAVTSLPNGSSDYAQIAYSPSQSMYVTVSIYEPGTVIGTSVWPPAVSSSPIITFTGVRPGRVQTVVSWDGIYNDTMAADGEYVYTIVGYSSSTMKNYSTGQVESLIYPTDRIVGTLTVSRGPVYFNAVEIIPTIPSMASSSETVTLPPYEINFTVPRLASVTIQAINPTLCQAPVYKNNVCRNIQSGAVYSPDIVNTVYWDGRDDYGNYLYADAYTIQLIAYNYPDPSLQTPTTWYETIDMDPFKIYDLAISDISEAQGYGIVSYQISVPMKVAVQIFKPGTTLDYNGNPSPVLAKSLVKAVVGVRPPFTSITELWDGTDRTLTPVPDGLYVFRIVSSTDTALIDSVTGEISNKSALADLNAYITPNVIAVSEGEDPDPCTSFANTTSFYPNPLRQSSGTFRITKVPTPGYFSYKIYNLPGDLIYEYDWGYQVPGSNYPNLEAVWRRENSSGRTVARGVYFAVMELKSAQGNRQVCQTVKKILVP
ncbi:MAG: hypothetical protein PHW69_02600 [Elusimicrobiaceae bacterium]|nr:hypothetical protein [Elusimicrobiaceae bacterium]